MRIYRDIKQGTEEWLELRAWVITGTKLKSVVWSATVQKTIMYELIWEEFTPLEENISNKAMDRGNELEPIAKAKYEELTGNKVEEVGFIKTEDHIWLSPDGIIATDFKENKEWSHIYWKAVEIKCPMWKNFSKYVLENKIPAEYKWQVVQYFVVMQDLEELDFVIYNPDFFIESARMKIITVTREDLLSDIETAKLSIKDFRVNWLKNIQKLIETK